MARTLEQIRQQIINAKNAQPALNTIDLESQVSELNYWIDITALIHQVSDVQLDNALETINLRILEQTRGTLRWYQEICFDFQIGDQLLDDGTYAAIDENKKIITRASVTQGNTGIISIKVAKGDVGSESALAGGELLQFTNYIEKMKFAGNTCNIISLNADQLKLEGTIYYDGIFSEATMKERVQVALEAFLTNKVTFDGKVRLNYIIDSLQDVNGLIDCEITTATAITGIIETVFTLDYDTVSGYIKESEDFPFEDTLIYVPVNS
jgi:hypothetical protein